METFLRVITEMPTLLYSVPVAVSLLFWLFVIFGAIGVDFFGGAAEGAAGGIKGAADGAAGALKGLGDVAGGAVKGAADAAAGAVKGAADAAAGAVKGAGDAVADSGSEAIGKIAPDAGLLAALGLAKVPITVSGSMIVFWGWFTSLMLMTTVAPALSFVPAVITKIAVFIASLIAGTLAAAVTARPLHRVFEANEAPTRHAFMGKVCTVTSGKVDAGFGTAALEDGGAGLILNIFCAKQNGLKKGDRALVLDYDPAKDSYEVEPVDWLLPEEMQAISDPERAAVIAAAKAKVR